MIKGNLLNLFTEEIYSAEIHFTNGIIKCIKPVKEEFKDFILPGFIDAHIHIESSMLTPSRFAEAVVSHGTTSVITDPHEIANVMGLNGIKYMMKDATSVPLNFFFTAPSCVPTTDFETSGAIIGSNEINKLLKQDNIVALGEMMNFPGVLAEDPLVTEKINLAHKYKKPVDGHAPLLSGSDLCKYIEAGISTDHECTTLEEVVEKRRLGMKIMLREGSSAQNLEDLVSGGGDFIVSDDKDSEDLLKGHLDVMLKKSVELGLDPIEAVKMVTLNPSNHYNLNRGGVSPGKPADIVVVDDLEKFNVKKVFINGNLVANDNKVLFSVKPLELEKSFNLDVKLPGDFEILSFNEEEIVRVIEVREGQLITNESEAVLNVANGKIKSSVENDILKISVVERYGHRNISNAFVHGFGLREGAIASSIAHDSHNIIVVGTSSKDMAYAVNKLVENNGGLVAVSDEYHKSVKLPVAGLMSNRNVEEVSQDSRILNEIVEDMGCKLYAPFMTLSFMALLVIPKLKISDKGLFDVENFKFVNVTK
ncbi:MAG: adenine deaminase [Methanobacterium sp.]|jgi:adenine deaminase